MRLVRIIKSRLSMKLMSYGRFQDIVSGNVVRTYQDCYGVDYLVEENYIFKLLAYRVKV